MRLHTWATILISRPNPYVLRTMDEDDPLHDEHGRIKETLGHICRNEVSLIAMFKGNIIIRRQFWSTWHQMT